MSQAYVQSSYLPAWTVHSPVVLPTFPPFSSVRLFRLIDSALEPLEAFDVAEGRDAWYTPSGGPGSRGSETAQVVATPYVTTARKKYLRLSSSGFPEHE
jgi:hypothetical protein